MKVLRVYLDASVFGGYFDAEFQADTTPLFDAIRGKKLVGVISGLVGIELQRAPEHVRRLLEEMSVDRLEAAPVRLEAIALRDQYLAAGIVGPRWAADALHVASATVERVDAIVSWNFKHIVRLDRIQAYNTVNRAHGYDNLIIVSPKDVNLNDDTEEL